MTGRSHILACQPLSAHEKAVTVAMEAMFSDAAYRMPPVDAIYRPHVVHHTIVPPEVKAQQLRSKAKRYFAAE